MNDPDSGGEEAPPESYPYYKHGRIIAWQDPLPLKDVDDDTDR